ncbi:hypothetical protein THAOC_10611, partial [Thalassiosira oceanica]
MPALWFSPSRLSGAQRPLQVAEQNLLLRWRIRFVGDAQRHRREHAGGRFHRRLRLIICHHDRVIVDDPERSVAQGAVAVPPRPQVPVVVHPLGQPAEQARHVAGERQLGARFFGADTREDGIGAPVRPERGRLVAGQDDRPQGRGEMRDRAEGHFRAPERGDVRPRSLRSVAVKHLDRPFRGDGEPREGVHESAGDPPEVQDVVVDRHPRAAVIEGRRALVAERLGDRLGQRGPDRHGPPPAVDPAHEVHRVRLHGDVPAARGLRAEHRRVVPEVGAERLVARRRAGRRPARPRRRLDEEQADSASGVVDADQPSPVRRLDERQGGDGAVQRRRAEVDEPCALGIRVERRLETGGPDVAPLAQRTSAPP